MNRLYPFYVGMSRSGCHWLRITLEGYLDGRSPMSNYFATQHETIHEMYKRVEAGEFPGTHDMNLQFETRHVVYMYRNPIDTIFSNLKYDGTPIGNLDSVNFYLDTWIRHIQKWVFDEKFTEEKLIMRYELLTTDFVKEFTRLLTFLKMPVIEEKILAAKNTYTKQKIRDLIHDKKVINIEPDYEVQREKFVNALGKYIYNRLPESHQKLFTPDILPDHLKGIWNDRWTQELKIDFK